MKRSLKNYLCSFMLLAFTSVYAQAQDSRKVAVFDPAGSVDKALLEIVREEISSVVVNTKGYTVLERQLINKVLEENKFQESGLVNDEQMSDIGKRMGADYVFVTTISTLGKNYYISCKMIEVATARIDKQSTGTSTDGINDIPQTTQYVVKRLFGENVQQQVVNKQSQQTDRPVQATAVQSDRPAQATQSDRPVQATETQSNTTPASRQSDYQQAPSYGRLVAHKTSIYSNGRALSPIAIRTAMANTPDALKYYNTAMKKRRTGKTLNAVGWVVFGIGAITELSLIEEEVHGPAITLGVLGFCAFAIPGGVFKGAAKRGVQKAVDVYNNPLYGYSEPSPSFNIDFGITSSGGVGFVINF